MVHGDDVKASSCEVDALFCRWLYPLFLTNALNSHLVYVVLTDNVKAVAHDVP